MPRYLGQHFLVNKSILQLIVKAIAEMIDVTGVKTMREIGPGQGALTEHIWQLSETFRCYEKDETMKKHLGQFLQPDHIVWGDVLEAPLPSSLLEGEGGRDVVVVGNLPYYITSPIFRKFFAPSPPAPLPKGEGSNQIVGGIFLIQKEVAEKIMTEARKKSYLWWLLNNTYEIEYLFTVPATAFDPPPAVESAVVRFIKKDTAVYKNLAKVEEFLDLVSGMKRKTLGKIQKILAKKGIDVGIPEKFLTQRLEELGWDEMGEIVSK